MYIPRAPRVCHERSGVSKCVYVLCTVELHTMHIWSVADLARGDVFSAILCVSMGHSKTKLRAQVSMIPQCERTYSVHHGSPDTNFISMVCKFKK